MNLAHTELVNNINLARKSATIGDLKALQEYMYLIGNFYHMGDNSSPIVLAAEKNHLECVKFLCTIPSQYPSFNNAFVKAVENHHQPIIDYLWSLGTGRNTFASSDNIGNSVSHCLKNNNFKALNIYLKLDFVSAGTKELILVKAIQYGSLGTIEIIVGQGVNIKKDGCEHLVSACVHNQIHIAKFLLEQGININSKQGAPLFESAKNERPAIVLFLLEQGANLEFAKMMHKSDSDQAAAKRLELYSQPYLERKSLNQMDLSQVKVKGQKL